MAVRRWEWAALAGLLVLLFCTAAYEAWTLGPTADEPSHILSSWLWWHGRDRLYPRDVPPLIKIVGGSAIASLALPVPADLGKPGDKRSEWDQGGDLFARLPIDTFRGFLFRARLPLLIFPLLTTFLLWHWTRSRYESPGTALVVAALWVLCPTALGHSGLFKNDLAATATYLLFWYTVWRMWRKPGTATALLTGIAAALVVLSKFSMLFVVGLAPLLLLVRALTKRRYVSALVWPVMALTVIYAVSCAAWQFEMHHTTDAELSTLAGDSHFPGWFSSALVLTKTIPVPEAAWTGVISLFRSASDPVPVFMLGQVFPQGHRAYFVFATLLKMSFPMLLLFAAGLYAAARDWRASDAFWLLPGFLYFGLASLASLHLGVRLVLPAWVFFFFIAGAAVHRFDWRYTAGALSIVFLLSVSVFPYGIAFFNPYAGDARNRVKLLADSNIDWGQSLGAVGRYAHAHRIEKLHLAYFGWDRQERYFKPGQITPIILPWDGKLVTERLQPEKGWYAISATLLPCQLFQPQYRQFFAEFLNRKPVAVAGGSIFLYYID